VGGGEGAAPVKGAEREVEVVEAGVGQLQGVDGRAEQPRQLQVGGGVGAEPVPGEVGAGEGQGVARALVRQTWRQRRHGVAVGLEPGDVVGRLGLALGVAKAAGHEPGPVHDAGVGGEDHVGQAGLGDERLHLCACVAQRLGEGVPLGAGPFGVDGHLGVHPRVDLVEHLEVLGRAH